MLTDIVDKPLQKLHLIDKIQRLGIEYHFEREIDEQLEQIHKSYSPHDHEDFKVFNKFKDSEGSFRESLISDVHGLLSLYEACHLRCHDDSILDEALPFATTHLESINESKVSTSLAKQVSHALKQPLRKGLPRLEARHYIPLYQEEPSHDEVLLTLAKLDFNLLQEQHQKELGKITRWDVDAMDGLPEYMQAHFEEFLQLYEYIGNELATKGRSYRLVYAKEVMLVRAYFEEAKWFHTNYKPTLEEYMPLQLITSGYGMLATTSLVGMGDVVTERTLKWSASDCKIVKDAQTICRLMDDVSSHKFEQKRGHVVSAAELLMKYRGAAEELQKGVIDAWKDTNEEFLCPTAVPMPILM